MRPDRQVQILEVAAGGYDNVGDPLQQVGKGRVGFTELGGIRPRARRGEPQLVPVCRPVGRRHATEPIDAVTSVRTACTTTPFRYSPTVQPCSSASPGSAI